MLPTLKSLKEKAQSRLKRGEPRPKPQAAPAKAAAPFPHQVGQTETLVDVAALIGPALVLNNGTFVRMLEVAPVDLEQGNTTLKHNYWGMFANVLRHLRAPFSFQIVVTSQPQDISTYLARWESQAREWQARADKATTPDRHEQCLVLAQRAVETAAFLASAHQRLAPTQQRYLVAVAFNPFPEALTVKAQTRPLEDKLVAETLEKLDERVQTLRAAMGEVSLPVYDLAPADMCRVLWEHYHHPMGPLGGGQPPQLALENSSSLTQPAASPCPAPAEFLAAERDPTRLAYLIAPEIVEEVETGGYVRVGEALARGYEIYDFDPRTPVDFAALLAFAGDVTHALYLEAADPVLIRRLYKEKETELKASSLTDASRGAITDHARRAAIASVEQARAEMEIALQAPYFLRWYAVLWANDPQTLEKKSQQFETQLKLRDLRYRRATRRHLSVVQSTRPVARAIYNLQPRNMSAEALGSFFPFIRREYLNPDGWHFGLHRGNGLLISLDPFEEGRANASELIIGAPRSGKSVYLKQQIETLLARGDDVFYFDPEREGLPLAVDHHGLYIELGRAGQPRRLPALDPQKPDSFRDGVVDLVETYEALAGAPLTEAQDTLLLDAYLEALQQSGIDYAAPDAWDRPAPLLGTVIDRLRPRSAEMARILKYADTLGGGATLNIMDINWDSENPWSAAAESLSAFVEAIQGERLSAPAFNALVDAYQQTMRKWGFEPGIASSRPTPPLSELVNTLATANDPQARDLAGVLKQYAFGLYADLFNCRTNVDVRDAQFVVFGMRSLRENVERNLAPVFTWQALRLVWNQIVARSAAGRHVHLFIDEAWYLLEQPGAALRLERMTRSFPKYGAALHLATHDALKLAASPEAQIIRDMTRIKVLFKQESEAAAKALGVFGLTESEQASLMRLSKGEAWLLFGHETHLPLYVAVNPLRLRRLSSNSEQMQAIARASGRQSRG